MTIKQSLTKGRKDIWKERRKDGYTRDGKKKKAIFDGNNNLICFSRKKEKIRGLEKKGQDLRS